MNVKKDAKAVSEVIGYILIITIVFIAIGLSFANIFPAVNNTEEVEHSKNSQRVFSLLQDNIEELVKKDVPSRGTEMKVKEGPLSTSRDTGQIDVTIDTGSDELNATLFGRSVTYETDSSVISYEFGAVFRRASSGNSVMLEEPNWRVKEDGPVILPLIRVTGTDRGVSGEQIALIEAKKRGQFVLDDANATAAEEVRLEITSPNADAWKRYVEELEGAEVDSSSDDQVAFIIDEIDDRTLIYTQSIIFIRIRQ